MEADKGERLKTRIDGLTRISMFPMVLMKFLRSWRVKIRGFQR